MGQWKTFQASTTRDRQNLLKLDQFYNVSGDADMGSPLIMQGNGKHGPKQTLVGIYLEQTDKQVAVLAHLDEETLEWIHNYADWTQDTDCRLFSSCACGTTDMRDSDGKVWTKKEDKRKRKRSVNAQNRINHGVHTMGTLNPHLTMHYEYQINV